MIAACKVAGFDLVIVETSGIGQGDAAIVPLVDVSLYVMTPEFGAASQLEKIDMLDFADFVAINKFDRKGAQDALRDVRKQFQRNREAFKAPPDEMPVFGTIASRFNDDGVTALYQAIVAKLADKGLKLAPGKLPPVDDAAVDGAERDRAAGARRATSPRSPRPCAAITSGRDAQARIARERQQLRAAQAMLVAECKDYTRQTKEMPDRSRATTAIECKSDLAALDSLIAARDARLDRRAKKLLDMWPKTKAAYAGDEYVVKIRDKEIRTALTIDVAVRHQGAQGRAAARTRTTARSCAGSCSENVPGQLPVHRRRVRVQARERGPDAHVRRRGRRVPHQPALPPARRRHAGQAAVDRVRLGHALRQRSRPAARHLRQGRQLRRVDRDARRHEGAVLGLRPVRAEQLGVDDDQRPGADAARDVHEHRDRPAAGQVPRGQRPRADRRRGRQDPRVDARRRCAAPCRPTS